MDEPPHPGLVDDLADKLPRKHRWWIVRYWAWLAVGLVVVFIGLLVLLWKLPTLLMASSSKARIIDALVSVLETEACPYVAPAYCKARVTDIDADWQWPGIWVSAQGVTLSGPYYPEPTHGVKTPPYPALDFLTLEQAKVWLNTISVLRGGKVSIHKAQLQRSVFLADSLVAGPPLQLPTASREENPYLDTSRIPVELIQARHRLHNAPDVWLSGSAMVLPEHLDLKSFQARVGESFDKATYGKALISGKLQYAQLVAQPLTIDIEQLDLTGVWPWVKAFMPKTTPALIRQGHVKGNLEGTLALKGPLNFPETNGTLRLHGAQMHGPDGHRLWVLDNTQLVSNGYELHIPKLSGIALQQPFSGDLQVGWANPAQPTAAFSVNTQGANVAALLAEFNRHVVPFVANLKPLQTGVNGQNLTGEVDAQLSAKLSRGHWLPQGQVVLHQLRVNPQASLTAMVSFDEQKLVLSEGVMTLTPSPVYGSAYASQPVALPLGMPETLFAAPENSGDTLAPTLEGVGNTLRPLPESAERAPTVARSHSVASGELLIAGEWPRWWTDANQLNLTSPLYLQIKAQQVPIETLLHTFTAQPPSVFGRITGQASARATLQQLMGGHISAVLPNVQGHFVAPALQLEWSSTLETQSPYANPPKPIRIANAELNLANGLLAISTGPVLLGDASLGKQMAFNMPINTVVLNQLASGQTFSALSAARATFCTEALPIADLPPLLAVLQLELPPTMQAALLDSEGKLAASAEWNQQQVEAQLAFIGVQVPVVDATTQHTLATVSNVEGAAKITLDPVTGVFASALSQLTGDVFTASQQQFDLSASAQGTGQLNLASGANPTSKNESLAVLRRAQWQASAALQPDSNSSSQGSQSLDFGLRAAAEENNTNHPARDLASVALNTQGRVLPDGHTEINDTTLVFSDMGTLGLSAFIRPEGQMNDLGEPLPVWDAHLTTPNGPLNLEMLVPHWLAPWVPTASPLYGKPLLYQPGGGALSLDVRGAGRSKQDALMLGQLSLHDAQLPLLSIRDADLELVFTGVDSQLSLSHMAIPGVDVDSITAHVTDTLLFPFHLEQVEGHASLFVLNGWERWIESDITQNLVKGLMIPLTGPPPPEQKAAPVPVVFYNAPISVDETVYDNILLENLAGKLSIHETGFVELNETRADVAEGKVDFSLSLDPLKNNYTAATLQADNVSANAMARVLLDAPNQIFGNIDGTIQFATEGKTQQSQFTNTNGSASFTIEDGRLPAITRVETLLSAANVLRGGVLGLSLNNVLRLVNPFEDDYFAALSGSVALKQGVAYTDDILSDGENLDLLIEGSVKLVDGYSDLSVYGDMTQNVDGKLGDIGKVSMYSVLRKVPGLGYLPFGKKNKGLLAYIPGVGYVPGLGGAPGTSTRFQVELEGTLDDPDVLKGFRWLP